MQTKSLETVANTPNKGFVDLIISLCRDSFNLLGGSAGYLTAPELQRYAKLLGKDLAKDELYFILIGDLAMRVRLEKVLYQVNEHSWCCGYLRFGKDCGLLPWLRFSGQS